MDISSYWHHILGRKTNNSYHNVIAEWLTLSLFHFHTSYNDMSLLLFSLQVVSISLRPHGRMGTPWSLPGSSVNGILQARNTPVFLGFPCGSAGKESTCNAGDLGSILGVGRDSLEKGKATHSSILAWRIQWTIQFTGSLRVGHDWATFTSQVLPGKTTGVGYHFLLQGIFLTQGSNPGLLLGRQILYYWATWEALLMLSVYSRSGATIWDPMDCSMPGYPVYHQLPELAQTHVHQVNDAIQPSHPLLSPSAPAFGLSQHEGLF